jgi:hypothetical protein
MPGFPLSIKEDNIQKVELVASRKVSIFTKIPAMATDSNNSNNTSTTSGAPTTNTTQLPGINPNEVKPSNPQMVKENFRDQNHKADSSSKQKK